MSTIEIKNIENDSCISALLDIISTALESEQLNVTKNKEVVPNTKGVIITIAELDGTMYCFKLFEILFQ